ncbi:hypothetical protein E2P81_ATG05653 [Venturia nashicola]|uniref:SMODS and SLOG-associating 2TM effector domain-containing protein n=1 Tax=Venturia nashicola TaxID=86259 RepID=A0A4Z1P1C0_9PEZI|nr:hypothetical protein E6O75_ATG05793 [Venturia nashicola]TLD32677.1 hypothetical protein E2P81_ATG05653 [Venturia nashicola]
MPRDDERTPLLSNHTSNFWAFGAERRRDDYHAQFCQMVGIPPSDRSPNDDPPPVGQKSLYGRALRAKAEQSLTYAFTAGISNTLLLSQVVLGAAVTGLGASASSHILITVFGALNTIIAGVVAYLKSRGQPMRARMYRDDLERVVDEIENSEVMWLGISKGVHGYDDINIDEQVTVRSEVARLTRLYDRAVRTNTLNNPDMYMAGAQSDPNLALKSRVGAPIGPAPVLAPNPNVVPAASASAVAPVPVAPVPPAPGPAAAIVDPDESPASAPPKPPTPPPPPPPPPPKEEPRVEPPKVDSKQEPKVESPKTEPCKESKEDPLLETPKDDPPASVEPAKEDSTLPIGAPTPVPTPAHIPVIVQVALDDDASPASATTNALSRKSRKSREDV